MPPELSSSMPTLLVVDDDAQIRRALRQALTARGYRVVLASSGEEALDLAATEVPDMVILDLSLKGDEEGGHVLRGLDVCSELRTWTQVPILVLSVHQKASEKVEALDRGADDYLTKPFDTGELLARIRSHLRRAQQIPVSSPVYEMDGLRLDVAHRQVLRNGHELRLTRTEYSVLAYLVVNSGRVVTYNILLNQAWGPGGGDIQTLRVHVVNLRRKLEVDPNRPRFILTEPGVGYRFPCCS